MIAPSTMFAGPSITCQNQGIPAINSIFIPPLQLHFRLGVGKSPYSSKAPEDWVRIQIQIHADGTVDGQVGDAQFVGCKVRGNRGWLGRKLNVKTDYIICDGALTGAIVSADKETKRYFTIPFNVVDGKLNGGFMVLKKWEYPFPLFPQLQLMKLTSSQMAEDLGEEAAHQPQR